MKATRASCPRLFEAEALRDGRLTGVEVARFQSHLELCPSCAREVQALQDLADRLRSDASPDAANKADELHVRRERTRLLAAFDRTLASAPPPRWSPTRLLAAAAVVALCAFTAFFAFSRMDPSARGPASPHAATAPSPGPLSVRANADARWSRRTDRGRETLRLERGTLSIRVDHTALVAPLLVVLPDGELEDIGTTFSVSADGARTTRVSVQEGSVVLRLRGAPPVVLRAGEAWPFAPSVSNSPPDAETAPIASVASAPAAASAAMATPPMAPARTRAIPAGDPSLEFRLAMSAMNQGDQAQAAARFAAFVKDHPRDSRAEDAAYLRVLALQRAGNTAAMQRAARDYLRRYPTGFRRAEVEPLTR